MSTVEVELDGQMLATWDGFHDTFSNAFGFPEFYGRNMDAWIDCMSYLDDPEGNISKTMVPAGACIAIQIANSEEFKKDAPEIATALTDCANFVNDRFTDAGTSTRIQLAFDDKGDTS